jgi:hypothetical protein
MASSTNDAAHMRPSCSTSNAAEGRSWSRRPCGGLGVGGCECRGCGWAVGQHLGRMGGGGPAHCRLGGGQVHRRVGGQAQEQGPPGQSPSPRAPHLVAAEAVEDAAGRVGVEEGQGCAQDAGSHRVVHRTRAPQQGHEEQQRAVEAQHHHLRRSGANKAGRGGASGAPPSSRLAGEAGRPSQRQQRAPRALAAPPAAGRAAGHSSPRRSWRRRPTASAPGPAPLAPPWPRRRASSQSQSSGPGR